MPKIEINGQKIARLVKFCQSGEISANLVTLIDDEEEKCKMLKPIIILSAKNANVVT